MRRRRRAAAGDRQCRRNGAASADGQCHGSGQAYETAFDRLLIVLAAITIVTALVVFLGLRRGSAAEHEPVSLPVCQEG